MQRKPISESGRRAAVRRGTTGIAFLCGDGSGAGALVPLFCAGPPAGRLIRVWPKPANVEFLSMPTLLVQRRSTAKREETKRLGPLAEKTWDHTQFRLSARDRKTKPLQPQGKPPVRCLLRGSTRTSSSWHRAITHRSIAGENGQKERYDVVLLFHLLPDGTSYSCEQGSTNSCSRATKKHCNHLSAEWGR